MIIDYKLTYPSGTATAVLINGFHTPKGNKMAKYDLDFSCIPLLSASQVSDVNKTVRLLCSHAGSKCLGL